MSDFIIHRKFHTSNVREISVDYGDNYYLVIYGKHINGGFFNS